MTSTGSYGWANRLVIQLAKLDHANVEFGLQADPATRHFICFVLLGWEKQGGDSAAFLQLAGALHSRPRRTLVRQFWDIDPGSGLMPLLGRLETRTMPRPAYGALGAILGDTLRRRFATQRPRLSAADLGVLAQHDTGLVEAVGMEALHSLGAEALEHAVQAVLRA